MATTQKLQIIIDAQNNANAALKDVNARLGSLSASAESLKPAFTKMAAVGAIAFTGLAAIMYKATEAAGEAEQVQAQLKAVLESTHGAAGLYIQDLNAQAAAFQKMTTYGDEAINSAQSLLLTFTNIKGPIFKEATGVVLDMSTALGQDLKASSIQVGKALNDPILGVSALRKVGVSFTKDQEAVIKKLVETGKTAEAQKLILQELNTEFGGSAAAAADTFAGRLAQVKNQVGDLMEGIGNALIPILKSLLEKVAPVITKMIEWANENPKLVGILLAVAAALAGLVTIIGLLGVALPAIIAGIGFITAPVLIVIGVIAALVAVGVLLYKNWDTISAYAISAWGGIKDTISGAIEEIVYLFNTVMETAGAIWEGVKAVFWTGINFILGLWITLLDALFPGWEGALVSMWNKAVEIWEILKVYLGAAWDFIKAKFMAVLDQMKLIWTTIWTTLKEVFTTIWEAISAVFDKVVGAIKSQMETLIAPIQKVIDLAEKAKALASEALKGAGSKISSVFSSIVSKGSSLTGRAAGGPVTGGRSYMVGEHGPEIFTPSSYGRISNGGGGSIILNITGNSFLGKEDVAYEIGKEIINQLRLNTRMQ